MLGEIVNLSTSLTYLISSQSISQRDSVHRCQAPSSEDKKQQYMQQITGIRSIFPPHALDFLWT